MRGKLLLSLLLTVIHFSADAKRDNLSKLCENIDYTHQLDSLSYLVNSDSRISAVKYANHLIREFDSNNIDHCKAYYLAVLQRGKAYSNDHRFEEALRDFYFILEEVHDKKMWDIEAKCYIEIQLVHEFAKDWEKCKINLSKAWTLIEKHDLRQVLPQYYVRLSSLTRFISLREKAIEYAHKAIASGTEVNDKINIIDGHLLLGFLYEDGPLSLKHRTIAKNMFIEMGERLSATLQYLGLARIHKADIAKHKTYLDSARYLLDSIHDRGGKFYIVQSYYLQAKKNLAVQLGQLDSALIYADLHLESELKENKKKSENTLAFSELEYNLNRTKETLEVAEKEKLVLRLMSVLGFSLVCLLGFLIYLLQSRRTKMQIQSQQLEESNQSLQESNRKNELLLTEIHHRVKNNLQTIIGIINFKESFGTSPPDKNTFIELTDKIYSIALIHDQLYQDGEFDSINIKNYIEALTSRLQSIVGESSNIHFNINSVNNKINIETTMPLGILLSELITNSIKHNSTITNLVISISLTIQNDQYELQYNDNGKGVNPQDLNQKGTGMILIQSISKQLMGTHEIKNKNGFHFTLHFSEKTVSKI